MATKTLREFAENTRRIIPETEWVTYDGEQVCAYSGEEKPHWFCGTWEGGKTVAKFFVPRASLDLKEYRVGQDKTFSGCIWGFGDSIEQLDEATRRKAKTTYWKKGVVAYFLDGSTVLFSTFEECKEFFGLKRVDYVSKYIESGEIIPNSTAYIDEAIDPEFTHSLFRR